MYPSTEMLISVQKYKLQYGKISPILSTQITAPVKKKNISRSVQTHKFQNKHIHRLCDYILQHSKIHVYNSTTVQQYLSQYKNISCGTKNLKKKWKEKDNNSTTMCIPVQKYKFRYKNKSFGTEKYFLKNMEKTGRYFIYDYYYVPKYMLIIVYLNKPYILHYCKLCRLYNTKHNHRPLYNPMHKYPTPCTPRPHQIPLNIHPFITPCTSIMTILHHIPLYITIHPYNTS